MTAPEWLVWLVGSGHIADIAIACLLVEAALLWRKDNHPRKRRLVAFNAASGIFLMLALRTALTDGPPLELAAFLTASFIMHMGEVRNRG